LGELRERMSELPKDKLIISLCKVGARGYLAERILKAHGYNAANLAGGIASWKLFNPDDVTPMTCAMPKTAVVTSPGPANEGDIVEINACGLACPGPIMAVKKKIDSMDAGVTLKVSASERGFMKDLPAWCTSTGNQLIDIKWEDNKAIALVRKGLAGGAIETTTTTNAVTGKKMTTIVLFSADLDKALAAFIISIGFATLGHEVSIFCTFWGLNVLRKDQPPQVKKNFISKMFGIMMPRGAKKLALSKMHMMGMGTTMMKEVMKSKNIDSLPEMIAQAQSLGVKLLACEMAMDLMGIQQTELLDGTELAGVANFAALSEKSSTTLFI
jgi:peroxiredoxin family protein/TusA-related sulfurtransferase